MRVIFLSSPYFGYVHTYFFDPAAYGDATAPEPAAQPMLAANKQPQPTASDRDPLLVRLAAWVSALAKENAPC